MSRAFILSNAATAIAEIAEAQARLNELEVSAREVAATIGKDVSVRFRRDGFSNDTSEVVFGLDVESAVVADGWRYVKTRDAVEPVRGSKGDAAREALANLAVPVVQPGSIVADTGMPQVFMTPGRLYRTQWMQHNGDLYALLPDNDDAFRNDPITGDWKEIRLSELHAADEARMDAAKNSAEAGER
ncbi:hypothetical protein IV500_06485 [Paeniglutamicibacter antarcticus]|uniref:Uncharacterized protein n=1 Tax=Arthrobacter terrae TaxID=2935737 RepID=A0A931G9U4_9MICC|nr:hypothetical protein [Arthrobacter terrae]MBG0739047.1 hypothetical protein [Arthrobacter terrae]